MISGKSLCAGGGHCSPDGSKREGDKSESKKQMPAGGDGSVIKCLTYKHEGLSSIPLHSSKKTSRGSVYL